VLAIVNMGEAFSRELSHAPRESSWKSGRSGLPLVCRPDVPASGRFSSCQVTMTRRDRLLDLASYIGESRQT
jgi:hypothetical protein